MKAHPVSVFSKTLVLTLSLLAMAATSALAEGTLKIGRQQDSTTLDPIFTSTLHLP